MGSYGNIMKVNAKFFIKEEKNPIQSRKRQHLG
jgi:hypothetical protein